MIKDDAYLTLYNLIFRGFLVGGLSLGKSLFVFKTVTEKEFEMVKACAGSPDIQGYLARFNMFFLAHSLFSLNGENVLLDRKTWIPSLARFFAEIPGHLFKYIMSELEKMRNDCYDALKYLEGFCYTNQSRRIWKTFKGITPDLEAITGIPGSSLFGMNIHQENWIYINKVMDDEENYDRELSLSLLVASASNPKGARQMRNHHESHMKNIEDHRKKLAEVGYIDTKNWSESNWAAPVDTAEELVAELDRQMKGMKDRHDRFIEEHMRRTREEAERKAKEAEARIRASRIGIEDMPALTVTQRPLTAEETAQLMQQRIPTVRHMTSMGDGEASERILRKMGTKILTARR